VQLLEYSVLPDKTIIWVITRNSIKSTSTTIARDVLYQKTQQYLNLLTRSSPSSADVKAQAEDLYTTLIQPARDYLDKNLQLCIIPDDKLNFVPFASLVSPATGKYLFEDYALQIAPSATVFITSTESAKLRHARGPERLLVVGNPRFDRERFGYLPDLPAARREAEEIARLYGSASLTGAEALVSRVKSALDESDVVHLATHALADDESPLLSKLLLATQRDETHHASSSYITAADIYRMKLDRPRLVVLSACRTGIEKAYRGEGAIGLARPFVVAGVPLVVASLWPVESEVTASLMVSFHKHRRHGVSTVEALRRAQVDALQNSQSNSSRSYDWAAFVVIGGYADF
jgi:CHAT domain-containing protein